MIHLTLFAHLNDPYILDVLDNSACMSLDNDVAFDIISAAPMNYEGIDKLLYCECIVSFGLWTQCYQALEAMDNLQFTSFLINYFMDSLMKNLESSEKSISTTGRPEDAEYFISVLVHLSRTCPEGDKKFYSDCFAKLYAMYCSSEKVPKFSKILLSLKLIGVALYKFSDFTGTSEFAELSKERKYNLLELEDTTTKKSIQSFFGTNSRKDSAVLPAVFEKINTFLINCDVTEEEISSWDENDGQNVNICSRLAEIGGAAHLSNILLQRCCKDAEDDTDSASESLAAVTETWMKYKPKLSVDDYEGKVKNFHHFCELMSVHGKRPRYQQGWLLQFVRYDEIFDHKFSLQLIDKIIVLGGDFDVVSALVHKALEFAEELSERGKELILKLLVKNMKIRHRRSELVKIIFEEGDHSLFTMHYFSMELNNICAKIGTIEKEKDPKKMHNVSYILKSTVVSKTS